MCFLLALLRRKKLAKHIRSFKFVEGRRTKVQLVQEYHHYQELELNTRSVYRLVKIFLTWDVDSQEVWREHIFDIPSSMDGVLALVLCLAKGLEHAVFGHLASGMATSATLQVPWGDVARLSDAHPFCTLHTLDVEFEYAAILPTMTTLRLDCSTEEQYEWLDPGFSQLQCLEIRNAASEPQWLGDIIAFNDVTGLTQLKVRGSIDTPEDGWLRYYFTELRQALVDHLPHLQVFEWSGHDPHFQEHYCLRSLVA
jgi:hypothetical protein